MILSKKNPYKIDIMSRDFENLLNPTQPIYFILLLFLYLIVYGLNIYFYFIQKYFGSKFFY